MRIYPDGAYDSDIVAAQIRRCFLMNEMDVKKTLRPFFYSDMIHR